MSWTRRIQGQNNAIQAAGDTMIQSSDTPQFTSSEDDYALYHIAGHLSTVAIGNARTKNYIWARFSVSRHAAGQFMDNVNTDGIYAASYIIADRWFNTEFDPDTSILKGTIKDPAFSDVLWTLEKADKHHKRPFLWAISAESADTLAEVIKNMYEAGAIHVADILRMYEQIGVIEEEKMQCKSSSSVGHFAGIWMDASPALVREYADGIERCRDLRAAMDRTFGDALKSCVRLMQLQETRRSDFEIG